MSAGPVVEEFEYELSASEAAAARAYADVSVSGVPKRGVIMLYLASATLNLVAAWIQAGLHRFGSASTIVASVFTAVYAIFFVGWFLRWKEARLAPAPGLAAKLRLSARGVGLEFGAQTCAVAWRGIERVVALDAAFVFVARFAWGRPRTIVLPRRVLAPGEAERIWNFIDAQLTAKTGLVRGVEYARPTIFNTLAR
jgi:hypothetical protein